MNDNSAAAGNVSSVSDQCLVCGGIAVTVLYQSTFAGSLDDAPRYFLGHRTATAHGRIVRCNTCSFVFTSPRFAAAEYDRIYAAIPPPSEQDAAFEPANTARYRRLCGIVRNAVPGDGPFLDFGCGDGGFLREFNSAAGRGFEVGSDGRRAAGQCDVISGGWAKLAGSPSFPAEAFNFIVAFDVFEHLPQLDRDITLLRKVLKPQGLLFASVPNIASFPARLMGERWNMLLLEHLWYFSPDTFGRLMRRHGFETVTTRSLPYDANVAHLATRLAQTFGMEGRFSAGSLSRLVVPAPAGIMLGVFCKAD